MRRELFRSVRDQATVLVNTAEGAILDLHCSMKWPSGMRIDPKVALRNAGDLRSLAADKGYDWMELREKLREDGVRPLIKHREFRPIDHAHNARIDGPRYRQRAMCETVFSTIKRTLGDAVRARTWYGEFRELIVKCIVHNIKRAMKQ